MNGSTLRLRKANNRSANGTDMASTEELCSGVAKELSQEEIDKIDPFTYTPPFSTCGKILVFINGLWLAPLRFLLIVVPMVIAGTLMSVVALIGDSFDSEDPKPLGKWGRFVHEQINPHLCRWFLFGFGFHWIHVRGTPAPSSEAPVFVVAPHSSMLDIFIMVTFGTPTFVARSETRDTPLFGPIVTRSVRAIYVSREDPESRSKSAEEIRRRAHSKGAWPHVLIYPEGTTTNRECLLKFKPGAFSPRLPVQPVLIKFNNKVITTSWGGDGVSLIGSLFYTLCQFHNSLEVEFLPVYHPSQDEVNDPRLFANNVQKYMAREVGIPAGNQSIEDLILMRHARSAGIPFSRGMVVYYKSIKDSGLRVEEMKKYLTRFADIDRNKDGFIEVDDLVQYLNVPKDACLQAVFDSCKKTLDGKVSFPDYLSGLVGPARPLLDSETFMQDMFNFFDRDSDGIVNFEDISRVLPVHSIPKSRKSSQKKSQGESIPAEINPDNFKSLLSTHPEYVLLFHECQNAGISSPQNKLPDPPNAHRANIQIKSNSEQAIFDNASMNSSSSDSDINVQVEPHTVQVCAEIEA